MSWETPSSMLSSVRMIWLRPTLMLPTHLNPSILLEKPVRKGINLVAQHSISSTLAYFSDFSFLCPLSIKNCAMRKAGRLTADIHGFLSPSKSIGMLSHLAFQQTTCCSSLLPLQWITGIVLFKLPFPMYYFTVVPNSRELSTGTCRPFLLGKSVA